MQKGSLVRRVRRSQSEVSEFRWREPGPTGTRRNRRIVVGSTDQIADESAARQAVAALQIEINQSMKSTQSAITIGDLVQHFRQRELRTEFAWRTFSTRNSYEGNLRKWIVPRWNEHLTKTLKAGEVELWLRSLPLAQLLCDLCFDRQIPRYKIELVRGMGVGVDSFVDSLQCFRQLTLMLIRKFEKAARFSYASPVRKDSCICERSVAVGDRL